MLSNFNDKYELCKLISNEHKHLPFDDIFKYMFWS